MFRDSNKLIENSNEIRIVENLGSEEFAEKLKSTENTVLIDVRTLLENQTIRIPDSILMDVSNPSFIQQLESLNRKKQYFLYCRSGNRSFHAGNYMLRIGFQNVFNLATGMLGWKGETESG